MVVRPADLKATLRARARAERERQRQLAVDVERHLRGALASLPSSLRPTRAWLIGSLAAGTFGTGSDVDVVVEGVDAPQLTALAAELSRGLPVPLDVLAFEEIDEGFRRRVGAEGVALHVS